MAEKAEQKDDQESKFPYYSFIQRYTSTDHQDTLEDEVAQLYNEWETFEQDVAKLNYNGPQQGAALLAELCPEKNVSIIDCGAGSGLSGEALVSLGYTDLVAIDLSQKLLDIAEKRSIYKKLVCCEGGNVSKLPFEENSFDLLYSLGCVGPFSIHPQAINEWVRIVKPGGIILFIGRHRYWQEHDGKHETKFREDFENVLKELESSEKAKLILRKVIPNYIDSTEGLAFAFKVL